MTNHCRTSAQPPATPGVEWLVPEEAEKNCWPTGKKCEPPGPPLTPEPSKQASAEPVPPALATDWPTPPLTCVPGAQMSGFLRPSWQGPRLEK